MSISNDIKQGAKCDSVGKPDSILGRAICLSVHPGKMMLLPFLTWFRRHYKDKYQFARSLFAFDMLLLGVFTGIILALGFLWMNPPTLFEDGIYFDASVAPSQIIAGAPSTLVIRYTNNTNETLKNPILGISYPDHFLLQEITVKDEIFQDEWLQLEDIPAGETGAVHVKGVMFGDVGGEQIFTSTLRFAHGDQSDIPGSKSDTHTFSPVDSTLELSLKLPEKLIAFQSVNGIITYHNTGDIPFPVISIKPEWPLGFSSTSSPTPLTNGAYETPSIEPGGKGELLFSGYLGDVGEDVTFIFHPSFTFDSTRYKQKSLIHTAPVVPPQVQVEHSVSKASVRPGANAEFILIYKNIGELTVSNVVLGISSASPFFSKDTWEGETIETLLPGERGEITLQIPLDSFIAQSETDIYENLDLVTRTTASYTLGDGSGQRVHTIGSEIVTPITSPIVLESFGRYTTAAGDQLGRGPLPPRTDITTRYWVFWRVSGTTNNLQNVSIEGTLGDGVEFTGRQTVSQGTSVEYHQATNTVTWNATSLSPTLSPQSKIIGIAFELGLTPTDSMIGTTPTLLSNIWLSAVDARTGAIISSTGSRISTYLPSDLMASGKEVVQ